MTDPGDVFYDHGEARLLWLVERVYEDLTNLTQLSANKTPARWYDHCGGMATILTSGTVAALTS